MMRTLLAFVGAPMIPAIIPAWFYHANNADVPLLTAWVFFCFFFYAFQIVIGVPAYLLLRRKRAHRVWPYLIFGFFGVAVPSVFWTVVKWPRQESYNLGFLLFDVFLYLGLLGAVTALTFWLLARPDKRAMAPPYSN
jgi:uncharacterized membrane protein